MQKNFLKRTEKKASKPRKPQKSKKNCIKNTVRFQRFHVFIAYKNTVRLERFHVFIAYLPELD